MLILTGDYSMQSQTTKPPTLSQLKRDLGAFANPQRANDLAWFFKTAPGEYGEGDRFLGIPVPVQRKVARRYTHLPLHDIRKLLASPLHEHRFTALTILVEQYRRSSDDKREQIFQFYLQNASCINNWDLVDTSAPAIAGQHLKNRSRELLDHLATSQNPWKRRIAIVSTLALIKDGEIEDAFRIAKLLLPDQHDLIHKAVGWALRETGKVSRSGLLAFLKANYHSIPRTALRYAIEHFSPEDRKKLLAGNFAVATVKTGCSKVNPPV